MKTIAITSAKRSPVGKVPGLMNSVSETDLLAYLFRETAQGYEDILTKAVTGSGFPIERDNLCRKAVLKAGLPATVSAATVSKTCASSDQALLSACQSIWSGNDDVVLVGGSENVSNNPYTLHFMKKNVKVMLRQKQPSLDQAVSQMQENDMAVIGEMLSHRHHITRAMQDEFTIQSRQRARLAHSQNRFQEELLPAGSPALGFDEWLEEPIPVDLIQQSESMFVKNGTITQYNAAPMCDCACAMVVMGDRRAKDEGLEPLGFLLDGVEIGVGTDRTGYAMEDCVKLLLERNCMQLQDIDLFELNESFAVQAISTIRSLDLDPERVNVNGGNLALGYPVGATGLRMGITLLYEMRRRKASYGISAVCAGGNMAVAFLYHVQQ